VRAVALLLSGCLHSPLLSLMRQKPLKLPLLLVLLISQGSPSTPCKGNKQREDWLRRLCETLDRARLPPPSPEPLSTECNLYLHKGAGDDRTMADCLLRSGREIKYFSQLTQSLAIATLPGRRIPLRHKLLFLSP
jgi:hypothetical protein